MVFYGVIGGFGLGAMYLPSVVIVSQYFEKKRGLATGLAGCGSGKYTMVEMTSIKASFQLWELAPNPEIKFVKLRQVKLILFLSK